MGSRFIFACAATALAAAGACAISFPEVVGDDGTGGEAGATDVTGGGGSPATGGAPQGGAGGTPEGGSVSEGGGGSGGGPFDCAAAYEFEMDLDDAMTNGCWTVMHPELATDNVADGRLVVTPADQNTAWWAGQTSYFLYREIDGPFAAVAYVNAHAEGNDADPPYPGSNPQQSTYLMAGLFLRESPSVSEEKWVKLEVGWREDSEIWGSYPVGTMAGRTFGSRSQQLMPRIGADYEQLGHQGLLGMCRSFGSQLLLFTRLDGHDWQQRIDETGALDDLDPLTDPLQIGLITGRYTAGPGTSIRGRFDYVRFAEDLQDSELDDIEECTTVLQQLDDQGD